MAENSDGMEKTERATPKRREQSIEEGQVAKSSELNSAIVLLAAITAFGFVSTHFSDTLKQFVYYTYHESSFITITSYSFPGQVAFAAKFVFLLLAPILIAVLLAGLGSNIAQVGFIFAKKALLPNLKKINPLSGIKRMFSLRSLVELAKGILKIVIIAGIAYYVVKKYQQEYMFLATKSIDEIVEFASIVIFELGVKVGIALLIMAVADYAYQRWEHEKSLKMTKQEVKDEVKQQEGDPKVKGKIRNIQYEMSTRRMMSAIPEATVVVTNPTFLAIALKYDPKSSTDAPKVVAKGKRKIAEKIKQIAFDHDIPIVENKPLVRSLYDVCEIGKEIPFDFYQAVAEILAELLKSKRANIAVN